MRARRVVTVRKCELFTLGTTCLDGLGGRMEQLFLRLQRGAVPRRLQTLAALYIVNGPPQPCVGHHQTAKLEKIRLPEFSGDDLDKLPESGFGLGMVAQAVDRISYRSSEGRNRLSLGVDRTVPQ